MARYVRIEVYLANEAERNRIKRAAGFDLSTVSEYARDAILRAVVVTEQLMGNVKVGKDGHDATGDK